MIRVLVAVSPRMYREAVALSIHRNRPGLDVRLSPPEEAEGNLTNFRPHLLLHNDVAPIPADALESIPCRVEVLYSDSMGARFHGVEANGRVSEVRDMTTGDLLRVVDVAAAQEEVGGRS